MKEELAELYKDIEDRIILIQENEMDRSTVEIAGRVSELTMVLIRISRIQIQMI